MQRLGDLLIAEGCLKPEQLEFSLKIQKNNGHSRLGQVLKHYHFVTDLDIARALAHQVGWDVYTGEYRLDIQMQDEFGRDFLTAKTVFPLQNPSGRVFILTRTDDTGTTDEIKSRIKGPVCFMIGVESQLRMAIEQHMAKAASVPIFANDDMLAFFERLLEKAVVSFASDIHIEPSAKAVEIRFRMDGVLHFFDSLHLNQLPKLVNVIFNKADVTISDFYHFHDARFSHHCMNRQIDVRVSHIPCVHGSTLVLRLLDKHKTAMNLTDLGYTPQHWQLIEEDLIKPHGVTLIVGPTGCGKTTSLYAMLNVLKDFSRKIVTIEDPVEMTLPLVTQVQVHEQRGLTFGDSVRAFLRHDPDIMLIGEIRDQQTAQEAMRASMTGHKVFATLHTTRAHEAILRLQDLGVDTHFICSCLTMVVAQRLVRKLCTACKKNQTICKADLKGFFQKYLSQDQQNVASAVGCKRCQGGYAGRTVVAEILPFTGPLQEAVAHKQWERLKALLEKQEGYISFEEDARRLVANGLTSLEEVVRVLG